MKISSLLKKSSGRLNQISSHGKRAFWTADFMGYESDGRNTSCVSVRVSSHSEYVLTSLRSYDVVGVLSRSLNEMRDFLLGSMFYQEDVTCTLPTKIIYPTDYFPQEDGEWQDLIDRFVQVLEAYLDIQKSSVNIAEEWSRNLPSSVNESDIHKYLEKSGFWPYCYEFYHTFDDFRERTKAELGRPPYATPGVAFRW